MPTGEKLSCKRCPVKVQLKLFSLSVSLYSKLRKSKHEDKSIEMRMVGLRVTFSLNSGIWVALHCLDITYMSADPQKTSDGWENLKEQHMAQSQTTQELHLSSRWIVDCLKNIQHYSLSWKKTCPLKIQKRGGSYLSWSWFLFSWQLFVFIKALMKVELGCCNSLSIH